MNNKIILWGTKVSPFVRKVMISLHEKELNFEQIEILPSSFLKVLGKKVDTKFERMSPLGQIPAIEIDDFYISDSSVIIKYLEHKFETSQSLYPKNIEEYAKVQWLENFSDNSLAKIATRRLFYECYAKPKAFGSKPDEKLIDLASEKQLPILLRYLENQIKDNDYFVGNKFTTADIAITTQLLALEMAKINIDKYECLKNYFTKIKSRPSIKSIIG